jgi:hypothetical protein
VQLFHAHAKGNFGDAEQAIQRILRLSRDLRPRGMMVNQLVSINLDSAALNGITDFTLGQKGLTAKDCDRLLALLTEQEREAASCADEGLRMEYVTMRNTLHILQQRGMSPQEFANLVASEGITSDARSLEQRLAQVDWQNEISAFDTAFAGVIALAATPNDTARIKQWNEDDIAKVKAKNAFVALILLPNVDAFLGAVVRHQAQLAGVECLTAVRRYALKHGSLPEDLEVAAKEVGLKAVPTDPYSGGPMHYKIIDGKPVVYSVGSDGKDDGGTVDWNYGKQPGDFIFRIRD